MGMNFSGYETMIGAHGEIYQAGMPSRLASENDPGASIHGYITRAVVLAVYFPEEDTRNGWVKGLQKNILCDVRTLGRISRHLYKVPVLQAAQGLWDEDLYVPRASFINITGGTLATGSAATDGQQPTAAESLDGEHVLVGFLENNPKCPVILPFTLGHPNTHRAPLKSEGRIRRMRHNGTMIAWDSEGNLTLDARGAAKPHLDSSGHEISNSGIGGIITIQTKDVSGAQSSIQLDAQGSLRLIDGAADSLELSKGSQRIALSAGQKITFTAGAAIEAAAPTLAVSASAQVQINSPSIALGDSGAVPLVKHPSWAPVWAELASALTLALASPTWALTTPVTHSELAALLQLILNVASGYAGAATTKAKGT